MIWRLADQIHLSLATVEVFLDEQIYLEHLQGPGPENKRNTEIKKGGNAPKKVIYCTHTSFYSGGFEEQALWGMGEPIYDAESFSEHKSPNQTDEG